MQMASPADRTSKTTPRVHRIGALLGALSVYVAMLAWTTSRAAPYRPAAELPASTSVATSVSPVSPADGASEIPTGTTLKVALAGGASPTTIVRFYARKVDASAGQDFTLIGLPDTQYYVSSLAGGSPSIFHAQTQWIVNERQNRNIAFVTHLGDCVEHGDAVPAEWTVADAAMGRIEDALSVNQPEGIPFGIAVGNHDQSPIGVAQGATTTSFNNVFGVQRFEGRSYFGGHYGDNNDNHFELFSAGGLNFIVIHFEYDPNPDQSVLVWADSLLKRYAKRRAILVSHYFINSGDPVTIGNQGWVTYSRLSANPNLFLMLNGHVPGEGRRTEYAQGRPIHMLVANYQSRPRGGDGWLRILEFSPKSNVIRVRTYSPTLDEYEADADSSSQFTLPYDMGQPDFDEVGQASATSNLVSCVPFAGFAGHTDYEWYVTVSDGATTYESPIWRFRTITTYPLESLVAGGGRTFRAPNRPYYDQESEVVLSAVPNKGQRFVGWSGDASGVRNPLRVTMDRAKSVTARFVETGTGVEQGMPSMLTMSEPLPAPSHGRVVVQFGLPHEARVRLLVVDLQGRAIATLRAGALGAGIHEEAWDGRVNAGPAAPSGTYFVVLEADGQRLVKRILLSR